jgi:carboxypeptidase family protein
MKLPYLKLYSLIIILAVIIIPYSCKKDTAVPPVATSISGLVTDINKTPVSNATVTGGTVTATTDANGKFTLANVKFTADSVLVNVTKDGFFQGSKNFVSTTGTVNNVTIRLIPKPAAATIPASSGGDVTVPGGGSVNFTGGFVNASNGSAYTGTVSVSTTYLNSTDQNFSANVPGNLKGVSASNQPGVLQSFGVVAVEMNDASGNKLQLAPGKTATITLPIPAALQGNGPASIPLWYFDDIKGSWKEEGTATKQGSNYVGVVNHFSFWNAGDLSGSVNLSATFIDSNGVAFTNKLVSITRPDSSIASSYTDSAGTVSGLVPVNEVLAMKVFGDCGDIVYSKNIGPLSKDTVLGTITIINSCLDTTRADIYVAGYEFNGSVAVAKYWKNGQAISLTDGTENAYASSIAVVGGDVYVAGHEYNGGANDYIAKYWKNGQVIPQQCGSNSIAVVGSDVYTAGVEYNGSVGVATYWKNGQATALSDGTKTTIASSVAVVGSDVYVAGYDSIGPGPVAKYWKNGQVIPLTDGTNYAVANSIVVVGSDVYVVGYEQIGPSYGNYVAKYWKNGQAITVADGMQATSIALVGSDVYVAGNGAGGAMYWKNGQAISLTGGSYAKSIAVVGRDVYVAGVEGNWPNLTATYWKNGQAIALTDGTNSSDARSIVVVKR